MASNKPLGFNPIADHEKWALLHDLDENFIASIKWFKAIDKRVFYCTHEDRLFARGKNDYGQLGIGHANSVDIPTPVVGLQGQQVVDIVGAEHMTLALTQCGRVYAWGRNEVKQIENSPEKYITRPKHMESLKNIVSIACGGMHSQALDKHGKMSIWGYNFSGQIGNNSNVTQSEPIELDMLTAEVITQIQCGAFNSMVLGDNGDVWAWGSIFNQKHATPVKLNVSNQKVKQIACAHNALVSLTQQGQIFIHHDNVATPQLIQPQDIQFTSVIIIDYKKFHSSRKESLVLANSTTQKAYHMSVKKDGDMELTESNLSPHDTILQYSKHQVSPFKMTLFEQDEDDSEDRGKEIADAFNKEDDSDLVFVFPEEDNKKIYGHRLLLRLFSPYMRKLLSDRWAKGKEGKESEAKSNEIEVSEYSYRVYHHYIEYLYTRSLPTLTLQDSIHLYDLANCHLEDKLKDKCVRFISRRLSVANCCKLYEFSAKYSLEDLKDKVIEFAKNNFFQIPRDSFEEISLESLLSFNQSIVTNRQN